MAIHTTNEENKCPNVAVTLQTPGAFTTLDRNEKQIERQVGNHQVTI